VESSNILGVRVHRVTMAGAVEAVRRMLRDGGVHQVVTVNGAMLLRAARDESIRSVLNDATLAVADGIGVVVAARILGRPAPARVPGVELAGELAGVAAAEGHRIFLLGAAPGVAEGAADALRAQYPGLQIAGVEHGYFHDEAAVVASIRRAQPHILFVAMGFPRQELWIAEHRERLGVPVSMGIGGTLDVLAGRARRAPRWVQRAGLEWAYRAVREPRRWRTAATLPLLILLAIRERLGEWVRTRSRRGY